MKIYNIDPRSEHRLRVRLILQLTGLEMNIIELHDLHDVPHDALEGTHALFIGHESFDFLKSKISQLRARFDDIKVISIFQSDAEDAHSTKCLLSAGASLVLDPRFSMPKSAMVLKHFIGPGNDFSFAAGA